MFSVDINCIIKCSYISVKFGICTSNQYWQFCVFFQIGNIIGHALPINKLMFSPTSTELVTVSDDHKVKVCRMIFPWIHVSTICDITCCLSSPFVMSLFFLLCLCSFCYVFVLFVMSLFFLLYLCSFCYVFVRFVVFVLFVMSLFFLYVFVLFVMSLFVLLCLCSFCYVFVLWSNVNNGCDRDLRFWGSFEVKRSNYKSPCVSNSFQSFQISSHQQPSNERL